ncbi:hypothetical protein E2C01_070950 [Portunus trituberculatus]|uniref:Uncharacterized protein n=1 Tax=Portunus trituberculatus TaxID=210409 RepID=A0A5B7I2Q4_PORTR|nr:hypothetical protein [Portunus trituberculatus]
MVFLRETKERMWKRSVFSGSEESRGSFAPVQPHTFCSSLAVMRGSCVGTRETPQHLTPLNHLILPTRQDRRRHSHRPSPRQKAHSTALFTSFHSRRQLTPPVDLQNNASPC